MAAADGSGIGEQARFDQIVAESTERGVEVRDRDPGRQVEAGQHAEHVIGSVRWPASGVARDLRGEIARVSCLRIS